MSVSIERFLDSKDVTFHEESIFTSTTFTCMFYGLQVKVKASPMIQTFETRCKESKLFVFNRIRYLKVFNDRSFYNKMQTFNFECPKRLARKL